MQRRTDQGKTEILTLVGTLIAVLTFLFGDNLYQQVTGRSIFQNPQMTPVLEQVTSVPERGLQRTVVILATKGWQETGVRVNAGDEVSISYLSGAWTWTRDYPVFDGEGDPVAINTCAHICNQVAPGATPASIYCPIEDVRIGALVGKVGANGETFYIGNGTTYRVLPGTSQAMLYLRMNDCGTQDNNGSAQVNIRVSR